MHVLNILKNMPLKNESILEQIKQILWINHAIILRSNLRNKFLKSRSNKNREAYKKQRNLCVSLLRLNKKDYFETLDIKFVTDNIMFWKTVAPLFSNKSKASTKITLSENEKFIINNHNALKC